MVVDVCGEAELSRQQDRSAIGVVQQDRRPVAAVVRLPLLRLPAPVAPSVVERCAPEHVPAVGCDLDVADDDIGVASEAAALLVQARSTPAVGYVGTGSESGSVRHSLQYYAQTCKTTYQVGIIRHARSRATRAVARSPSGG